MERVLLEALGEESVRKSANSSRPPMDLENLDELVLYLQVHAIERSTRNNYATGARNYLRFCRIHNLPLNPTPQTLSRYIAYTSHFIASGPKYLTGARHFLKDFFPDFTAARADAAVQATIRGSKKLRADPIRRKPPLRTSHLQAFLDTPPDLIQSYFALTVSNKLDLFTLNRLFFSRYLPAPSSQITPKSLYVSCL